MILLAYITGQLDSEERIAFEHRLLEDAAFSNEMEEQEFALLEEYSTNMLQADQQQRVETWLMASPYHREHVTITRALRQLHARKAAPSKWAQSSWWMATAACIVVSAAMFFLLHKRPSAASPQVAAIRPLPNATLSQAAPAVFEGNTILLQSERLRGPRPNTAATYVFQPERPTRMQILVHEAPGANSYSLDIRSATNAHFAPLHFDGLRANSLGSEAYVEVILPGALPTGTYNATLRSQTGSYVLNWSVRTIREPSSFESTPTQSHAAREAP